MYKTAPKQQNFNSQNSEITQMPINSKNGLITGDVCTKEYYAVMKMDKA